MTKHRLLFCLWITVLVVAIALPAQAAPPPKNPTPAVGQKAGNISALLPIARITRGAGRTAVTSEAKKGDELIWNDLIKTERGGRARITLVDQSILSLGSQAELKVVKHNAATQQTALQLGYGRLRAEVTKIARQGGSFELRTPTAVAGVIGTDFGTDASSVGSTTFICIAGVVQVANLDPAIAGSVQCAPGMTTTVSTGKAPTPPAAASPQQIQQLIQDTEPAIITAISPTSALPGATLDTTVSGTKLAGVNQVTIDGAGAKVNLVGTPTDTSVTIHVVLDPSAPAGPRTITLSKPAGAASAAVFTVLSPPGAAVSGDLKKPYFDLFDQERLSARAGLTAFLTGVQQLSDLAAQQLQQTNPSGTDLSQASASFSSQVLAVQNAINQAGAAMDQAAAAALASFDTQYQAAYNALLQRNPSGAPDDTFNQAVQGIFQQVNATLGTDFNTIRGGLSGTLQSATSNINQLSQSWMSTLAGGTSTLPTPNVNNSERSIDLGAAFGDGTIAALDASSSKAAAGAGIMHYSWVLCDPAYKPAQFGVPVAANSAGCNPISGYASSNSDFAFTTCNLSSGDYIARVTVTDTNNQSAAMDVKLHVLPPTYDDPVTRLRTLATAYSSLQIAPFLAVFDEINFPGYSAIAENIRVTFPELSSMNINLRTSQASVSCNDATLRADWQLNYTYKQVCTPIPTSAQLACTDPNVVYSQAEQLSVRMVRTPGKGWYITDFQGDNGKLQFVPAVVNADSSAPDLQVTAAYPTPVGASSATALPLPPGSQQVTVTIANTGTASLSQDTTLDLHLIQDPSTEVATVTGIPVPSPLAAGATEQVTATINVPTLAGGTSLHLTATVDPACSVSPAETSCGNNSYSQPLVIGAINFQLALAQPFSPAQNVLVGGSAQIPITLTEPGSTFPISISAGPANGNLTYTVPSSPMAPGSQTITVTSTAGVATGNFPITINAGSYGVTQSVTQTLNFVSAQIVPTTIFLNDQNNPLEIQMTQTNAAMNPPIGMKLSSTPFGGATSPATIYAPAPNLGFNSTVDNGATTQVVAGGTFNWQIIANYGASTTATPLTLIAQLPNSNPPAVISYTLYVKAVGAPDLQVVSVTPITRAPSIAAPWLSGEGIDFSVVIKNNGPVSSAGGERITMTMSNEQYEIEQGSPTPPVPALAPGATAPVTVHAVAPDVNAAFFNDTAMPLKTKIWADNVGDLNYADNSLTTTVPTSNWSLTVSGAGIDDTNYLLVQPGMPSVADVVFSADTGVPGHSVNVVPGVVTSGFSAPTFGRAGTATATLSNSTPLQVNVTATSPNNGYQYVQVIAEMVDGGKVTAQRQATIHVVVGNPPASQAIAVSIAPLDFSNAGTPLQLNGPLVQNFTVTPFVNGCPACSGSTDLTFNDALNTVTSPGQFKAAVLGVAQLSSVAAALDANGNVTEGAATGYVISATGTAIIIGARRGAAPSPSPVGISIPLYVNVGDIHLSMNSAPANNCYNVIPGAPALALSGMWHTPSGFNAPITWEIQDANHMPAGATPVSFTMNANSASTYPASWSGTMSATTGTDGLQEYFIAVTISNTATSATKYFPFYVDSSISQNFCGAAAGARGFALHPINGTWSRVAAGGGGTITSAARTRTTSAAAGQPDLRLSTSDIVYTPSMPKVGDAVQVRFRVSNDGTADAVGVPIALQVNGATVAIDKFDVPAGRTTLAGLEWAAANLTASGVPVRRTLGRRGEMLDSPEQPVAALSLVRAALVIDPQHTIAQKTNLQKSAPLAHFSLRSSGGSSLAAGAASVGGQRILLELEDGACAGLRLTTGSAGPCGSTDVEITIADLARSSLMLSTLGGIAEIGVGPEIAAARADAARLASVRFSSQVVGLAGHSYAVQLANGRTAVLTLVSVRNPRQLDARTRALFRVSAVRLMRKLAADSGPGEPGDTAGTGGPRTTVFLELTVQTQ